MYYRSLNAYLRETFGFKVYKLALSAGCTCPNRDGTLDARGCIFCSGSGEFAASAALPVSEQLTQAKRLVAAKAGPDARYIAYFQDYSNTYAPADQLRPLFLAAIDRDEICALSIATRPDCLPPEILALLAELRERKPVWVELGLQTIHASTARYIRRGYPLSVFDNAVRQLKALDIHAVCTIISGVSPGSPRIICATTWISSALSCRKLRNHDAGCVSVRTGRLSARAAARAGHSPYDRRRREAQPDRSHVERG